MDDRMRATAGEWVGIPHGGTALRRPWEALKRAVDVEFKDSSQDHRDRIVETVALGRRAYLLVSDHRGSPAEIVAAKRIDTLAEACDIQPAD